MEPVNAAIICCSATVHALAQAAAEGAEKAGAHVRLHRPRPVPVRQSLWRLPRGRRWASALRPRRAVTGSRTRGSRPMARPRERCSVLARGGARVRECIDDRGFPPCPAGSNVGRTSNSLLRQWRCSRTGRGRSLWHRGAIEHGPRHLAGSRKSIHRARSRPRASRVPWRCGRLLRARPLFTRAHGTSDGIGVPQHGRGRARKRQGRACERSLTHTAAGRLDGRPRPR